MKLESLKNVHEVFFCDCVLDNHSDTSSPSHRSKLGRLSIENIDQLNTISLLLRNSSNF